MSLQKEVPQSKSTLTVLQTDLESDSSLEKAAEAIKTKYGRLDVLVNNAGASFDIKLASGEISMRDAYNAAWNTNVVGPQILTTHLAPLLIKSSNPRLVFVSSGTSSLADTLHTDHPATQALNKPLAAGWPKKETFIPMTSYRASKTGLNIIMRDWVRVLTNDGVKVWGLEPGFLATEFGGADPKDLRALGAGEPSDGGEIIRSVVEGERDADVGRIVTKDGLQRW